jgi:hypothetical protein
VTHDGPIDVDLRQLCLDFDTYDEDEWRELRQEITQPCHVRREAVGWCPHVGCRYHLYLDVDLCTGAITVNFPGVALEDMTETCAMRISNAGGETDAYIAAQAMNTSTRSVRDLIDEAFESFRAAGGRIKGLLPGHGHEL